MQYIRWTLMPIAVLVVYVSVFVLSFTFITFLRPIGESLYPVFPFIAGALAVFAGAAIAPSHKTVAAIGLTVAGVAYLCSHFDIDTFLPAMIGGGCASGFAWLWFDPMRSSRTEKWVHIGETVCGYVFCALVASYRLDCPAFRDSLPSQLGSDITGVCNCYTYHLPGNGLDSQDVWQLDVTPEAFQMITDRLKLSIAVSVPPQFWRKAPYWWPRHSPPNVTAWQSHEFPVDAPASNGSHYFLLYDPDLHRVFVWVKSGS